MIIAVSGGIGAGETTLAGLFEKKGFKRLSESDLLRQMLEEQGKELTRDELRKLGDKLRKEKGDAVIAEMAFSKTDSSDWVIDALYTRAEFEFLKSKGVVIVAVTAPIELRFERAKSRGDIYEELDDFVRADRHDSELGIDYIIENADFLVTNDGSLAELEELTEGIIACLSQS